MIQENSLKSATSILKGGGILLHPTATVYGLACDPNQEGACRKIRSIKNNAEDKPLLLITDEFERIALWFERRSALESQLMELREDSLHVTILFDASKLCPIGPRANSKMVGIRRTKHVLSRELISLLNCPIVSTSANKEGQDPSSVFTEIDPDITASVDLAISDDTLMTGTSSTLIRVENDKIKILRSDALSRSRISDIFGSEYID